MLQKFVESIAKMVDAKINEIHTTMPGTIVSFDTTTGLATVLPTMRFKMKDGTTVPYPQITGVPVLIPQAFGQQATIAYPVKPGDGCLIFIAEHSIEYWLYGQETETDLSFDLTDAFCIPGLFRAANSVMKRSCDENAIIVAVKDSEVVVKKDEIAVNSVNIILNGDVKVNGSVTATGEILQSASTE